MFARRIACHAPRRGYIKHSQRWHIRSRQEGFATSSGGQQATSTPPSASMSAVQAVSAELDRIAPRIDIDADQIDVIHGPKQFYRVLKEKIRHAKRRIYLATLYFGESEHDLVACIRDAIRENPELQVSVLTDALRGTRQHPGPTCASLLSPLAAEFPDQVEIRMYHTPNLTGIRKRILPRRLNEGWGLQHMKLYGIDDEVILSGANLNKDYFIDRQDRYHIFSSKQTTDYYGKIHEAMCSMSMKLEPGEEKGSYDLIWPESNACVSPLEDPKAFVHKSKTIFEPFITPGALVKGNKTSGIASIYPVLIIPRALNNELPAMQTILNTSSRKVTSCMFTAGYFNPDPAVTSALLNAAKSGAKTTVLTASPWANGFYNSKGISGMLPAGYTLLSRRFLQAANKLAPGAVELREWRLGTVGRPHGWTYHAKGMWLSYDQCQSEKLPSSSLGDSAGPSVTIIGSSNYTIRSYSLDTEVGAVVVTDDPGLKAKYKREEESLLEFSRIVTEKDLHGGERRVGPIVRIAMWIVSAIGGSL